jgi:uncharacterized protein YwqG
MDTSVSNIKPEQLLLECSEDAVVLLRQYPPRYPVTHNSFIGGDPFLPLNVDWPTNKEGVPLHFLAQIDCSEIPALNEDFPSSGVLYFFAKIDEETTWAMGEGADNWRVIYSAESHKSPISPPDTLPSWGGKYCDFERNFGSKKNSQYNSYAKWPLIPKKIQTWPSSMGLDNWWEMDFDHDAQRETINEKRAAQLTEHKAICSVEGVSNAEWDITKPFPYAWLVVERICRYFVVKLDKKLALSGDVDQINEIITECKHWIQISEIKGLENVVTSEFQDKFLDWASNIQEKEHSISRLFKISVKAGMVSAINQCGANEILAAHFSEEIFRKRSVIEGYHQMFGYGPSGGNYTQAVKSEEILLLHLSSDTLSEFLFCDCDAIVFKIKPEDLQLRDFDKTTAIIAQ